MKVAILTIDSREHFKDYHRSEAYFGTAPTALLQGLAKIPEIEVHVVSCLKEPVGKEHRIAENIFYHGLHVPGAWVRTLYSRAVDATREKLREIKPDLVHGQGTERDCALAAVRSGFPNLITIHGNMLAIARMSLAPFFSFQGIQARLETWTIRRTIGVICLSRHTQEQVRGRTPRTWIVPNAVSELFFNLKRAEPPSRDLICVANIVPLKNQNFLIRALDSIAEQNGMRLRFFGGGTAGDAYFEEFKALVAARTWCSYEGFKSGPQLHAALQSAWATILPSLEENCPMALLEGMAAGVPVIAARSGGTPDLIDDGVTGLMFNPTDAESVRAAVLKIFNDSAYRQQLAVAGKQRAIERHLPQRVAEKHLEIYREALKTVS